MNENDLYNILLSVLTYDKEAGLFYWVVDPSRAIKAGSVAGCKKSTGYISIAYKRKEYLAHRIAFLFVTGKMPNGHVDHIDGNRSNNKWENLRTATQSQNMQNRVANSNSLTGLLGVSRYSGRYKKPWRAKIVVNGKAIHLGSFDTAEDAASAYEKAKKKYHTFHQEIRRSA